MATATMSGKTSSESPGGPVEVDPRVAAFCSRQLPELFHAVAYANTIWKSDPFDVESIIATHPDVQECAVIAAPDAMKRSGIRESDAGLGCITSFVTTSGPLRVSVFRARCRV